MQFHPEASPGPQDTAFLFDDFLLVVAANAGVPLVTDLPLARALVKALREKSPLELQACAWSDYVARAAQANKLKPAIGRPSSAPGECRV